MQKFLIKQEHISSIRSFELFRSKYTLYYDILAAA